MASLIPVGTWLCTYERRFIARDLAAGLAVGTLLIPQGLALAQLIDVPLVAGLWSGVAAMILAYVERAKAEPGRGIAWQRADEPARPSGGRPDAA